MTTDLRAWHRQPGGGVRWRLTPAGVEVEGEGLQRTPGDPTTCRRIWREFRAPLVRWSTLYQLPVELLIATAATESRGNPGAIRTEPGYVSDLETPDRVSIGLMQTLLATAREVTGVPWMPHALLEPNASTMAGGGYVRTQADETRLDPVLVCCSYNAGGAYPSLKNRWGLRQTEGHADRFTKWIGDAIAVVGATGQSPPWMWRRFLDELG